MTELHSEPSAENPEATAPELWGPVASLLLGAGIFTVYSVAQAVVLFASLFLVSWSPGSQVSGLQFALSTVIACPLGIAVVIAAVRFRSRRRGSSVRRYLGLRGVRLRDVALSVLLLGVFMTVYNASTRWLGRPTVPDFMLEAYASARFLPLLYLAIVIAAPLFEELLFRGFLLPGLVRSRLGVGGGIAVASLAFAVPHLQYDLYDMSWVFLLGALLGFVRWKTGSVWLAFGLHALNNLLATLETAWFLAHR